MHTIFKYLNNKPLQLIINFSLIVFFSYAWWSLENLSVDDPSFAFKEKALLISTILFGIMALVALFNLYALAFRGKKNKKA